MTAVTGHSEDLDSADAIAEALDACAAALAGKAPQAGLLFAGIDHDHPALLDAIEARYPGLQLIGGTTHGELSQAGFAEDSVVLMLLHSERVQFRAGVGEGARADPEGAARRAVAAASEGLAAPPRLCLTVPEGLEIEMMRVLDGLTAGLAADVLVCGGTAGDQIRFERTVQFCNAAVYTDAVPVLLVGGPVAVAASVASGWQPVGAEHRATRVEGSFVFEIDGEPARDVWIRYVGTFDRQGDRNMMAVFPDAGADGERSDDFYVATLSHFEDDGRMVMLTPILPGARIRFADATRDELLTAAETSAERAWAAYPGEAPAAALVFSCAARHLALGTRVEHEFDRLQKQIGTAVPTIGIYTYGEICPLPASLTPYPHGGTFVTLLLGEDHE